MTWPMNTTSQTRNFILLRFSFTWWCSKCSSTAMRLWSWSILASASVVQHPGIRMSSAMLMTWRPSRTIFFRWAGDELGHGWAWHGGPDRNRQEAQGSQVLETVWDSSSSWTLWSEFLAGGHVHVEVSGGIGGGPAAESLQVGGSAIRGGGRVHFLMKSALRVGTPKVLLASVLSKAGWSVSMTWKVRLQGHTGKMLGWECVTRACRANLKGNLNALVGVPAL